MSSAAKSSLLFLTQTLNELKLNVKYLLEESFKHTNENLFIYINPIAAKSSVSSSPSNSSKPKAYIEYASLCKDRYQLKLLLNQFYRSSFILNPNINVTCLLHNVHTMDNGSTTSSMIGTSSGSGSNEKRFKSLFHYDIILTDLISEQDQKLAREFCSKYLPPVKETVPLMFTIDCSQRSRDAALIVKKSDEETIHDQLLQNRTFDNSIVAGTFDRLHTGHKILLSESALLTKSRLLVGITDGPMLKEKKLSELIESLEIRTDHVLKFLSTVAPFLQVQPVPIHDPFGPSITEKDYECLIVSKETIGGGASVNRRRTANQLPEMQIHVIDLVSERESSLADKEMDEKVSSSNERYRLLGSLLKPPYKPHVSNEPYVIGLTGGMSSGKTAIGKDLEALGAATIDCDKLGHRSYEIGQPAYHKLIETFGADTILDEKTRAIDRAKLRHLIRLDDANNQKLKQIVWPEIRKLRNAEIQRLYAEGNRIIVVEAALLLDAKWHDNMNEIWVSFISNDEAIRRSLERNPQLKREEAVKLLESQMTNQQRIEKANVVFCSQWPREITQQQVNRAWQQLLERINPIK